MRGLIDDAELMAIREASTASRGPLFITWLEERGRLAIRSALRKVATRRGQAWLLNDDGFVEDAISWASFAAWNAIVGYERFCPLCRIPAPGTRYATKLHRTFETERGLRQHGRTAHDRVVSAPTIGRRTMYMIGATLQGAVRKRARHVVRYQGAARTTLAEDVLWRPVVAGEVSGPTALPTGRRPIDVEDASALERLAALERHLDRERKAAVLPTRVRSHAAWLLSGMSAEDVLGVSSSRAASLRRMYRRT